MKWFAVMTATRGSLSLFWRPISARPNPRTPTVQVRHITEQIHFVRFLESCFLQAEELPKPSFCELPLKRGSGRQPSGAFR